MHSDWSKAQIYAEGHIMAYGENVRFIGNGQWRGVEHSWYDFLHSKLGHYTSPFAEQFSD